MADNFQVTEGSGTTIATTQVGNAHEQHVRPTTLPPDAATETTLAAIKAKTDNLDVALSTLQNVQVTNFPATQNVSVVSAVETEIKNDSGNPVPVSGTVSVGNFPGTQPVSGTVIARETGEAILGVYYYSTGVHLVLAAADAATVARWYLVNPIGSNITLRFRRIRFMSQLGSALAAATSPRLQLERFTFTGAPTGAVITPAKRKTADATPVAIMTTANTGMVVTNGAVVGAFLPIASATAVGYTNATAIEWNADAERDLLLAPGEGLLFRQPDAGTTSDTRRFITSLTTEEF